jgi:methionine-rich copper-binding protein CopC
MKYLAIPFLLLMTATFLIQACRQIGLHDTSSAENSTSNQAAPYLVSVIPADNETGVPINRTISITFSEVIDASSLTANTENYECTGNLQVSYDDFSTCVKMSGSPVSGNSNRSFVFTPSDSLDASTDFDIKLTTGIRNSIGQALSEEYVSATCFVSAGDTDQTAPSVTTITPFSIYDRIPLNTSIVVTFDEAMNIPTLTTTTAGTTCMGSVQLSANGFYSCVPMVRDPEPSANLKSFVITPISNLAENHSYSLKITTAVTDGSGNPLENEYLTTKGLITGTTEDTSVPTITSTTPINGFSNSSLNQPVTVTFSERMNPTTIRTNISGTGCSNAFSLSSDDFNSCIRMCSNFDVINSGRSFAFYPVNHYSLNTKYSVKVTIDAQDLAGNPLAREYYFVSGYTTTQTPWDYSTWDSNVWGDSI